MNTKESGSKFKAPAVPMLCVKNCGFYGSAATRGMCSKCHKEALIQEHREAATVHAELSTSHSMLPQETKKRADRCTTCRKCVGLFGYKCRCGNLCCLYHRHADRHGCVFDYRAAARDAICIPKVNPFQASKLVDRI